MISRRRGESTPRTGCRPRMNPFQAVPAQHRNAISPQDHRSGCPMASDVVSLPATGSVTMNEPSTHWIKALLPEGRELPEEQWQARHKAVLFIIFGHAVGLAAFGLVRHWGPLFSIGEGALIGALGLLAAYDKMGRRFRASVAALALVTSSAVLVQFWGG